MMKIKQKLTFLTRVLGLSGKAAIKNKISVEEAIVTRNPYFNSTIFNQHLVDRLYKDFDEYWKQNSREAP